MTKLKISKELLLESLSILKEFTEKERVILWLGTERDDVYLVEEIFLPIQITEEDYFRIPPEGMAEIMKKLKATRTMLVAQVHTHPFKAYHSHADDQWAILRHINAYSIVLPWFASTTNLTNFKLTAATFVLTDSNKWAEIDNENITIL